MSVLLCHQQKKQPVIKDSSYTCRIQSLELLGNFSFKQLEKG